MSEERPIESTRSRSWLQLLNDAFRDPRERSLHRVVILSLITLLLSVAWIVAASITAGDDLREDVLTGGAIVLAGWVVLALAISRGMPYTFRMILTGAVPIISWMVLTYLLGFGEVAPWLVGLVVIWGLTLLLLFSRSWLVVFDPAEVVVYQPIVGLPRFISSPLDEIGNPTLNYKWIAPLDSIKPFWSIDDRIAVNQRYEDIITAEGYMFALEVRLLAEFDPAQIKATLFELKMTYMQSRAQIRTMLQSIVDGVVELVARDFFIDVPHQEALAAGSVKHFKDALPELMASRLVPIGLRVVPGSVTCIPYGSTETRQAAERAAAAPYATEASLSVQKELLRQALDGSVSAQLVLYAQMAAQNNPAAGTGTVIMPALPEHFLQAVNQQNRSEAQRLFTSVFGEPEEARFHDVPKPKTSEPKQRRRSFDLGQLDD